ESPPPDHKSQFTNHRSWLFLAGVLFAAASAAQDTQYFPEPSKPKLSFQWDLLARFDYVWHRPYTESIERGRFELRPELDFDPSDSLRFGFRAVFDYGTEAYNYPAFDNFRARGGTPDRYYVLWRPDSFAIRVGRFGMPLVASDMLWDHDIQTPGGSAAWTSPDGAWTIAAAGFYAPQNHGDRSRIGVGQVVWRRGDEGRL